MRRHRWLLPVLLPVLLLVAVGCAPVNPNTLPPIPPEVLQPWRVQGGDVIRMRVWREPDLSGEVTVQPDGSAVFPALGRLGVAGLTADSLNRFLTERFRQSIVDTPIEAVIVRAVPLLGGIRAPGVYPVDPSTAPIALVARAGGTLSGGKIPRVRLVRASGDIYDLPLERPLGQYNFSNGDALQVEDANFFVRNQTVINVAASVTAIVASLASLIFILR